MDEVRTGSLKPGDEVAGKYRVDRVLGRGGMGIVLSATHTMTRQRVALKLLLSGESPSAEQVQRFLNEARAAVQIQSEHVARVTDVDRLPSGEPYIVMEYLEGQDLGALIQTRGPLPVEEALDYLLQACEALAEAHALGIVHRDLKPANLFLTHRRDHSPLVKVLDFGISRLNETDPHTRLTRTRGAMGSPLYMSPEQLMTPKDVDARSDIWSLGVVLFELLSGSWPFEAETMEGLVVEIATNPPRALRTLRPDVPAAVDAVIARCLEKRREHRFGSVAELATALAPVSGHASRLSIDRISRILSAAPPPAASSPALTIDPRSMPEPPFAGTTSAAATAVMVPVAASSAVRLGTRSIEPTAQTLGDVPGPTPATRNRGARWPFVAGGATFLGAAALFALTRSPPPPTAVPSPNAAAPAGSAPAASPVAAVSAAPSPVLVPVASTTLPGGTAPPASTIAAIRQPTKGAHLPAVVGAASPAVVGAAPPAATAAKPAGPADFGGK